MNSHANIFMIIRTLSFTAFNYRTNYFHVTINVKIGIENENTYEYIVIWCLRS
jgi:hypothetical protein